jgi:superfamily II RNA helicase
MDERGHVVTVQTRFEGVKEAAYLATAQADPLVSQFTPSYGMVLNLLQNHTLDEAKDLVERSFGQYLAAGNIQPQQEAIAAAKEDLESLTEELAHVDLQQLENYQKLRDRIKEERRLLKTLQSQAQSYANEDLSVAVSFAVRGTFVSIKGANVPTSEPISAILMDKIPGPGQAPYLIVLGRDNRWRIIAVDDVVTLHAEIPRLQKADALTVPQFPTNKPGTSAQGDSDASEIASWIPPLEVEVAPEVKAQQERLTQVQNQLENHPARKWGKPGKLLKKYRRAQELEAEIQSMEADLEARLARRWQEFLNLIKILRMFGALSDVTPTPLGETAAAIRGDNELWLGMVLSSGKLDNLDPHCLAAACAAFVTEVSRPDSWSNYSLSSEVSEALNSLWGLRKQLIKIQSTYGVDILVLPNKWQDRHLIALVEQWALEVEWQELYENTSLDEGDIIRILRRTLDFLSQIPHVPNISPILVENARRAIQLLDRFPVSESLP